MNLIAHFSGFDGSLANEILDSEAIDTKVAVVKGNRITVIDGDGKTVVTAVLEVTGKTAYWHLFKGARGRELGIATEVRFSV